MEKFIYIVENGEVKKHYIKEKKSKLEILMYVLLALLAPVLVVLVVVGLSSVQSTNHAHQKEADNHFWMQQHFQIQMMFLLNMNNRAPF